MELSWSIIRVVAVISACESEVKARKRNLSRRVAIHSKGVFGVGPAGERVMQQKTVVSIKVAKRVVGIKDSQVISMNNQAVTVIVDTQ